MRTMADARKIKVDKAKLIEKIKENKTKHEAEYAKAVEAYRKEASKQLKENLKRVSDEKSTDINVRIKLTTPVNKTADYDKLITQFEWEQEASVELSQGEFNQYVHDETPWAMEAKFSNSAYLG